jgi:tetraacyldisaccharide 4'-kinase
MRAPDFWEHGFGTGPALLSPLSLVYRGGGLMRRALVRPWRAPVPVICVGGLVVGGSGKTPVALALGALLQRWGRKVHFLARGYGGKLGRRRSGPARVDPERHGVAEVGDEALLLAAQAPTWVARDRRAGARAAVDAGADILVMDDGLQYPGLIKDLSLIVVDGTYGFGNRRVIPSGPLREPIRQGLKRADVLVLVGENISGVTATIPISMPLLRARLVPGPEAADLATGSVVAFAGGSGTLKSSSGRWRRSAARSAPGTPFPTTTFTARTRLPPSARRPKACRPCRSPRPRTPCACPKVPGGR